MAKNDSINNEAWDLLRDDERTAISLSLGHGKSTWESGEIMNRAHFKYLEIQKRARKFLEIFTNHFEKYDGLFPENLHLPFAFKEYLILTILERKNISESVRLMEDPSYMVASKRKAFIIAEIERLRETNTKEALDMYGLIMDFDRWNNFRILPVEVQEPSAFKRRNKARNKKHLKRITSIHQFSVLKLIENFSYSGNKDKLYLPIVSGWLEEDYKIIGVRETTENIQTINDYGLFLFREESDAIKFGKLVSSYFINSVRNCKMGQKFWPEFREIMAKAYNYRELQNIHKSRTYLDSALYNRDYRKKKTISKKQEKMDKKPSDDNLFYL